MTIISTLHYDAGYCNAFWNGEQMTYGDGDGAACQPLSGGLDVVSHELTHGVTEFTSGLIYENESGALNEAFSDMMGNTAEFYADRRGLDPAAEPDWLIGEDVIAAGPPYGGTNAGFRNMGDPRDDGDPDHYSERYRGTNDNGGVHTNSGIPNHAYWLAVNGGTNAGCDSVGSGGHVHAVDCDVRVPAIGLARAQQVFYQGFTSLTEYANFCDARSATMAVAGKSRTAVNKAWAAVGVQRGCTPAVPSPPPCVGDATAQIPVRVAAPVRQQRRLHVDVRQRVGRVRVPLQPPRDGGRLRLRIRQGRRRQRARDVRRDASAARRCDQSVHPQQRRLRPAGH